MADKETEETETTASEVEEKQEEAHEAMQEEMESEQEDIEEAADSVESEVEAAVEEAEEAIEEAQEDAGEVIEEEAEKVAEEHPYLTKEMAQELIASELESRGVLPAAPAPEATVTHHEETTVVGDAEASPIVEPDTDPIPADEPPPKDHFWFRPLFRGRK
jgi:hypothetical protein